MGCFFERRPSWGLGVGPRSAVRDTSGEKTSARASTSPPQTNSQPKHTSPPHHQQPHQPPYNHTVHPPCGAKQLHVSVPRILIRHTTSTPLATRLLSPTPITSAYAVELVSLRDGRRVLRVGVVWSSSLTSLPMTTKTWEDPVMLHTHRHTRQTHGTSVPVVVQLTCLDVWSFSFPACQKGMRCGHRRRRRSP